jgi:ectoine hydroxylase-related dioxygenase (phytanoyl-CoA dioxygenase family)
MNRLSSAELLSYKNDGYIGLNRQLFSAQKYQQLKVDVQQLIGKNFEPNESKTLTTIHMSDPKFLEWAAAPEILDQVEQIIGSNIALWAVTMFLKRAHSTKFVEWHCDSKVLQAYKCFDQLEHVSLLVAMSPNTLQQGCVSYIPGTHLHRGERAFKSTPYEGSLFGGVIYSLEESEYIDRVHEAKAVELQEGEYSFHDIHSVHASEANQSDTDRILLNFKYFPTHIKPLPQNLVSRVGQSQDCYLLRGVNLSGGELVNMQTDLNEPT